MLLPVVPYIPHIASGLAAIFAGGWYGSARVNSKN